MMPAKKDTEARMKGAQNAVAKRIAVDVIGIREESEIMISEGFHF